MEPFPACPRCAGIRLRMPGVRDGVGHLWQNMGEYACDECGLRATPVWFDDVDAYRAYRVEKGRSPGPQA